MYEWKSWADTCFKPMHSNLYNKNVKMSKLQSTSDKLTKGMRADPALSPWKPPTIALLSWRHQAVVQACMCHRWGGVKRSVLRECWRCLAWQQTDVVLHNGLVMLGLRLHANQAVSMHANQAVSMLSISLGNHGDNASHQHNAQYYYWVLLYTLGY